MLKYKNNFKKDLKIKKQKKFKIKKDYSSSQKIFLFT